MADYTEISMPSDTNSFHVESNDHIVTQDSASDSLWQQQLLATEQEMLKEKAGKRALEDPINEQSAKKIEVEFEKYWNTVMQNPTDFQAWTVLLQHIDQSGDIECGRNAYNSFFLRYPYCYGYWKKYADLEKRKGTEESTLEVFNRGLKAIKLSVDLWIHYLEYVIAQFETNEDYIRNEFEHSTEIAGLEFRSDKLWDLYITWETNGSRWKKVCAIYDRLIATPVSKHVDHWQRFQEFIKQHSPTEILSSEQYNSIKKGALVNLCHGEAATPLDAPPGEEAIPTDSISAPIEKEEEIKQIRKWLLENKEKIYEERAILVRNRWNYEDAIKRPYFHVKPLEKSQLSAWRAYLSYEISQKDDKRIKILFERCLIACAFYEEFWMRYIRYLEGSHASEDELRMVYKRACNVHLQHQIRPRLAWAAFEEASGNLDTSMETLKELLEENNFSLEANMMAVGIQRRSGNVEGAKRLFENCLDKFQNEKSGDFYCLIVIKYARFLNLFCNNAEKAIEIVENARKSFKDNSKLFLALSEHALSLRPPRFELAAEALKAGTENHFPSSTRLMFAHRYLNFMTECAHDSKGVNKALGILQEVMHEATSSQITKEKTPVAEPIEENCVDSSNQTAVTIADKTIALNGTATVSSTTVTTASYQPYQNVSTYTYNQGYPQSYNNTQYQNWGYSQQGNYNYNQQGWGYPNYYGSQR